MLIIALYFSAKVGLKEYFNEYYYITPNLVGKNIDTIELSGENLPIKIVKNPREFSERAPGEIFMQDPIPGKKIKRNRIVRIWVSKGSADIVVPDVKGLDENDAKSVINSRGLTVGNISTVSLSLQEGEVVGTDPAVGSEILRGGRVSLLVNRNSNRSSVRMPDLLGFTLDEAKELLQQNSLIMGTLTYTEFQGFERGIVIETSVEANKSVGPGTVINIVLSK